MPKLFKTKLFFQIAIASLFATLATVGIVTATTTVGNNISTDGTLTVNSETYLNGDVGIGTTSPSQALSVTGKVYTTGGIQFSDGSLQTAAAAGATTALQNQIAFYNTNGSTVSGTSTITLLPNGNVGVGTSSPNWRFSVAGISSFDDLVRASYFTATSTTATSTINTGGFAIGTSTPYGNGLLTVGTSSPSFYVDRNSGKVGIGTSLPLANLHIGSGATNNSVDSQVLISRSVDDAVSGNGHAFSDSSQVNRSGVIGYNSYDARINIIGSNNYDHFAGFQSSPVYGSSGTISNVYGLFSGLTANSGTITNAYGVYIAAPTGAGTVAHKYALATEAGSGYVGIGTVTPTVDLEIKGSDGNGKILLNNSSTIGNPQIAFAQNSVVKSFVWYSSAASAINIGNANGSNGIWVVPSTGNVGIGTTSPSAKLSVNVASTGMGMYIAGYAGGTGALFTVSTTTSANATSTAFIIDSNGNVGIGTSSPASLLHVSAGASATTTVEFGAQAVTSKTCFNVRDALGAATSFYFVGTTMVIEPNRCK